MARGTSRSSPSRAKGSSGGGIVAWIGTLLLGVLLAVVGFGSGLVLGIASEEPELVVGHLAARTQDVPWHIVEEVPPLPQVAAGARDEPSPASPGEALPPAAVAVAAPRGAGFAVQVGAFSSDAAAREVADGLETKGHPAYVVASVGARDGRWRVRVGPFSTRVEADQIATRLKTNEGLPTWVLSESE